MIIAVNFSPCLTTPQREAFSFADTSVLFQNFHHRKNRRVHCYPFISYSVLNIFHVVSYSCQLIVATVRLKVSQVVFRSQ